MIEVLQSRCISIIQAESSGQEGLEPAIYRVGNQTQLQFTVNMYSSVAGGRMTLRTAASEGRDGRRGSENAPWISCHSSSSETPSGPRRFFDEFSIWCLVVRTTPFTCRAGCKDRDVAKNRNAGPVKCKGWFAGGPHPASYRCSQTNAPASCEKTKAHEKSSDAKINSILFAQSRSTRMSPCARNAAGPRPPVLQSSGTGKPLIAITFAGSRA
jgi:hypothetical protein